MGYKESTIVEMVNEAFNEIELFYQRRFVNFKGITIDTGVKCNEVVCRLVNENWDAFDKIKTITRISTYKTASHIRHMPIRETNRLEERIAIEMFNQRFFSVGEVIDYQTPLKNTRGDKTGKIDLLLYNGKTLYLLELKRPDSGESMLRCILEGHTYYKTIDHKKLLHDFCLPANTEVKHAPLVFKDSIQHNHLLENRPQLEQLMKRVQQEVFLVEKKLGKYEVERFEL